MAEAIFTVSAEITPQIDEQELQQQANRLANQFNGILSKKIAPIAAKPVSGSFRPFQAEIARSQNALQRLQLDLGNKVPRAISNVARAGKGAFLKFTDAVNLTRRDMVGFGGSIVDTIRNTNRFTDALDGIKAAGSGLADLPQGIQQVVAQVQSGTSVLDRFAQSGDKLAQFFQPVAASGAASVKELSELNTSIDTLTLALGRLAAAQGNLEGDEAGKSPFQQQIERARELQEVVKGAPAIFSEVKGSIDKAFLSNSPEKLLQELVDIKNRAQETTGPMGRIAQLINEQSGGKFFADNTREARELAIVLEQETIATIKELFGSDVLGPLENLNANFRKIGETAKSAFNAVNSFRTALASILPGQSPIGKLVDSVADSVTFFKVLRAEGLSSLQAIRGAAKEAFEQFGQSTGLTKAVQRIKSELTGLGLIISQSSLGKKFNEATAGIGSFLNKNLIAPLQLSKGPVKQAFQGIGKDIVNGLGLGIKAQKPTAVQELRKLADDGRKEFQNRLGIKSPSTAYAEDGKDTVRGYAQGIEQNKGIVTKALGKMGDAVKAVGQEFANLAKSVVAVTATTFAGLGAVALKTGADFNILKQVIGSTLPVLVGSKEGAADLLEQVNLLNNSSPFARSAFLELTRVLAGFGVEAQRITPLIDAIQQTVAATGGSDEDLLELGQAFAKIQSQGKVSAEVLQSFSVRGVDAVGVLARGFQVTTGEMRSMISDGLVPADKAIDVLTTGLKEKFDGATEAVAKNFPGALQRVQARLRDIGGTLLTAFINPAGGGALVDFLNNMADSLSHVNKELLPKLAPALKVVSDLLVTFSEKVEQVVKSLSADEFGNFVNKLKPLLPLLAGLAGFAPAAFGWIPVVGPLIAGLGGPITAVAAALGVFLVQSGKLGTVMDGITGSFSGVGEVVSGSVDGIKDNLGGLALAMTGGAAVVTGFITKIGSLVQFVTSGIPVISKLGEIFAKFTSFISKGLEFIVKLVPGLAKLTAEGSKLGGGLKILTGPIGTVAIIIGQLILTSQRFRESIGNLFNALKPTAALIANVFTVAVQILDGALKALEPVFTAIVNLLAGVFHALNPVIKRVGDFLGFLSKHDVISKFFDGVRTAIETTIGVINGFIDVLDKALGPFINLPEINIKVKVEDPDIKALKKAQEEARKEAERLRKAAADSAAAIEDNYNKAAKGVELAQQRMDGAIDALTQGLSSIDQKLSPVFEAAKAAASASKAIADARAKEAQATADITKINEEYTKALQDSITPVNELNKALRDQTRIKNGIRSIDRELEDIEQKKIDLGKEKLKLTGQEAEDDRASLARAEERAQISLNRAKQAELDLLNELNGANRISLNLAGLSLDQIRDKLAAARLSSTKDRKKTAQEIADDKASARLDVLDAEQAKKDATAARDQFELDTKEKIKDIDVEIRDLDERKLELQDDKLDALLEEEEARKNIIKLQQGETTQAQIIADFADKIKDATQKQREAHDAIKTAMDGEKLANLELQLASATLRGDTKAMAEFQQKIWDEKRRGVAEDLDGKTLTAIGNQKTKVQELLTSYQDITKEVQKRIRLEAGASNLQGASASLQSFEATKTSFERAVAEGNDPLAIRLAPKIDKAKNDFLAQLRNALINGAAEQKDNKQEPWFPSSKDVEAIIREVANAAGPIRDAIRIALERRRLSMPGFAAERGLSPQDLIHRGMNDGKGLVRMFEFGKEAVLPLTRPTDMRRVVNDPQVLPAILDALNLPGMATGSTTTDAAQSAKLAAIQDKLVAARKAALAEHLKAEASLDEQEDSSLAVVENLRSQAAAAQQLNVQLQISEELLRQIAVSGGGAVGNSTNIINNALTNPDSRLRVLLQEIFNKLGLQFPGFAGGYAPGEVHSGLNNGRGLVRMFEYGKEAVLPLTRSFDMARVVRNPAVLPAILNALPRWSRPDNGSTVSGLSSAASDLSTVVRSARMGGGPANAEVYEKKNQREFADTIGEAVRVAVKSAIEESGGLGGDDIDINVNPNASDTQRMIAREVRRQLDKRTGKW